MDQSIRKQIRYTLSTHAVEHLTPSKKAIHLCEQMLDGTLNAEAAVAVILRQYGLKKADAHG